ncbi:MAG: hypothetical protein KKG93_02590 [Bacteroidetes bacterium]|nr:hypothetical protein [Bacteroidota bacterium]
MKRSLLYIIIIFLISCDFDQKKETYNLREINSAELSSLADTIVANQPDTIFFDSAKYGLNFKKGMNYQNSKNKMAQLKSRLYNDYTAINDSLKKEILLDSIMTLFSDKLLNEIVPYWYGTEWDFNGYTAIPNKGKIACGYFVSTTLKDMGLNVNKYKLAQQGPENEAKSIAILSKNMFALEMTNFNNISELLKEITDGLYFVGLDFHVGYFYKNKSENYFIHSNYIDGKVMIEMAEHSDAFVSSRYDFSKISANKEIALSWINSTEIKIIE